jgi:hypothetical protein
MVGFIFKRRFIVLLVDCSNDKSIIRCDLNLIEGDGSNLFATGPSRKKKST